MIRSAEPSDAPTILSLLEARGLITADLAATDWSHFFVYLIHGKIVGIIGVEIFPTIGLLRSLAVAPDHQGRQIGTGLMHTVISHAQTLGLTTLYLLTTTAPNFFERFGFTAINRDETPSAIKATAEFSQLCPAEAVVMRHGI